MDPSPTISKYSYGDFYDITTIEKNFDILVRTTQGLIKHVELYMQQFPEDQEIGEIKDLVAPILKQATLYQSYLVDEQTLMPSLFSYRLGDLFQDVMYETYELYSKPSKHSSFYSRGEFAQASASTMISKYTPDPLLLEVIKGYSKMVEQCFPPQGSSISHTMSTFIRKEALRIYPLLSLSALPIAPEEFRAHYHSLDQQERRYDLTLDPIGILPLLEQFTALKPLSLSSFDPEILCPPLFNNYSGFGSDDPKMVKLRDQIHHDGIVWINDLYSILDEQLANFQQLSCTLSDMGMNLDLHQQVHERAEEAFAILGEYTASFHEIKEHIGRFRSTLIGESLLSRQVRSQSIQLQSSQTPLQLPPPSLTQQPTQQRLSIPSVATSASSNSNINNNPQPSHNLASTQTMIQKQPTLQLAAKPTLVIPSQSQSYPNLRPPQPRQAQRIPPPDRQRNTSIGRLSNENEDLGKELSYNHEKKAGSFENSFFHNVPSSSGPKDYLQSNRFWRLGMKSGKHPLNIQPFFNRELLMGRYQHTVKYLLNRRDKKIAKREALKNSSYSQPRSNNDLEEQEDEDDTEEESLSMVDHTGRTKFRIEEYNDIDFSHLRQGHFLFRPQVGIPNKLYTNLLAFQLAAVDFIVKRRGRGLIADEMGCGKTLQAIACMCMYRDEWPCVIVTPPTLRLNWVNEILRWCADFILPENVIVIDGGRKVPSQPLERGDKKIILLSYGLASSAHVLDWLYRAPIGMIICDESHYLKNPSSARCKAIIPLIKKIPRAVLLSGTPMVSSTDEIFPQIHALKPGIFCHYSSFYERYNLLKKYNEANQQISSFNRVYDLDGAALTLQSQVKSTQLDPKKVRKSSKLQPSASISSSQPASAQNSLYEQMFGSGTTSVTASSSTSLTSNSLTPQQLDLLPEDSYGIHNREVIQCEVLLQELNAMLIDYVMIRRLKKDVLTLLPKVRHIINIKFETSDTSSELPEGQEHQGHFTTPGKNTGLSSGGSLVHKKKLDNNNNNNNKDDETPQVKKTPSQLLQEFYGRLLRLIPYAEDLLARMTKYNPEASDLQHRFDLTNEKHDQRVENAKKKNQDEDEQDDQDEDSGELRINNPLLFEDGHHDEHYKIKSVVKKPNLNMYNSSSDDYDGEKGDSNSKSKVQQKADENGVVPLPAGQVDELFNPGDFLSAVDQTFIQRIEGEISRQGHLETAQQRALIMKLYQLTGILKLPYILGFINNLLQTKQRFLIFAHHLAILDIIQEYLWKRGVSFFRVDGSVCVEDRQKGVEAFQAEGSPLQCALLSITAAGLGLTLTKATKVIFAELFWTPSALIQAEDRAHRLGQESKVDVYYLLGEKSLDMRLWPLIKGKLETTSVALDGGQGDRSLTSVDIIHANDALNQSTTTTTTTTTTPISTKPSTKTIKPSQYTNGKEPSAIPINQREGKVHRDYVGPHLASISNVAQLIAQWNNYSRANNTITLSKGQYKTSWVRRNTIDYLAYDLPGKPIGTESTFPIITPEELKLYNDHHDTTQKHSTQLSSFLRFNRFRYFLAKVVWKLAENYPIGSIPIWTDAHTSLFSFDSFDAQYSSYQLSLNQQLGIAMVNTALKDHTISKIAVDRVARPSPDAFTTHVIKLTKGNQQQPQQHFIRCDNKNYSVSVCWLPKEFFSPGNVGLLSGSLQNQAQNRAFLSLFDSLNPTLYSDPAEVKKIAANSHLQKLVVDTFRWELMREDNIDIDAKADFQRLINHSAGNSHREEFSEQLSLKYQEYQQLLEQLPTPGLDANRAVLNNADPIKLPKKIDYYSAVGVPVEDRFPMLPNGFDEVSSPEEFPYFNFDLFGYAERKYMLPMLDGVPLADLGANKMPKQYLIPLRQEAEKKMLHNRELCSNHYAKWLRLHTEAVAKRVAIQNRNNPAVQTDGMKPVFRRTMGHRQDDSDDDDDDNNHINLTNIHSLAKSTSNSAFDLGLAGNHTNLQVPFNIKQPFMSTTTTTTTSISKFDNNPNNKFISMSQRSKYMNDDGNNDDGSHDYHNLKSLKSSKLSHVPKSQVSQQKQQQLDGDDSDGRESYSKKMLSSKSDKKDFSSTQLGRLLEQGQKSSSSILSNNKKRSNDPFFQSIDDSNDDYGAFNEGDNDMMIGLSPNGYQAPQNFADIKLDKPFRSPFDSQPFNSLASSQRKPLSGFFDPNAKKSTLHPAISRFTGAGGPNTTNVTTPTTATKTTTTNTLDLVQPTKRKVPPISNQTNNDIAADDDSDIAVVEENTGIERTPSTELQLAPGQIIFGAKAGMARMKKAREDAEKNADQLADFLSQQPVLPPKKQSTQQPPNIGNERVNGSNFVSMKAGSLYNKNLGEGELSHLAQGSFFNKTHDNNNNNTLLSSKSRRNQAIVYSDHESDDDGWVSNTRGRNNKATTTTNGKPTSRTTSTSQKPKTSRKNQSEDEDEYEQGDWLVENTDDEVDDEEDEDYVPKNKSKKHQHKGKKQSTSHYDDDDDDEEEDDDVYESMSISRNKKQRQYKRPLDDEEDESEIWEEYEGSLWEHNDKKKRTTSSNTNASKSRVIEDDDDDNYIPQSTSAKSTSKQQQSRNTNNTTNKASPAKKYTFSDDDDDSDSDDDWARPISSTRTNNNNNLIQNNTHTQSNSPKPNQQQQQSQPPSAPPNQQVQEDAWEDDFEDDFFDF